MNNYHRAMNFCAPPADLEARLQQKMGTKAPAANVRVIRPWSFTKRMLLAAVVSVMITVSVGAAVLLDWDAVFANRFGSESAALPITETAYQKVNVTAVCDDVTLTVREALGDDKTIYLILDYQVPVSQDKKLLQTIWDSDTDSIGCPTVSYFATDAVSWEDLSAKYTAQWTETDWADGASRSRIQEYPMLRDYRFPNGGSWSASTQGYDPETGTLTYLLRFTTESSTKNLTEQPLTLLVLPPLARTGEEEFPLAEQPALITFQPEYSARAKTGEIQAENREYWANVSLSPVNISVEYYGTGYESTKALRADTLLVCRDGSTIAVASLSTSYSGGNSVTNSSKGSFDFNSQFENILDTAQVTAVRIGNMEIPVK